MATRRQFLQRLGRVEGYSAVYRAMQTLGLLSPATAAPARPFMLPTGSGNAHDTPIRVGILGAGITGLVAAYELQRAGYAVQLYEAHTGLADASGRCAAAKRLCRTIAPISRALGQKVLRYFGTICPAGATQITIAVQRGGPGGVRWGAHELPARVAGGRRAVGPIGDHVATNPGGRETTWRPWIGTLGKRSVGGAA